MNHLRLPFLLLLCLFLPAQNLQADFVKNKIAVLPFTLQGENFETNQMGVIVSEWLITAFVKDGRFDVIERKLLGQIMEEQQMVETGIVTQESASELGRLLGVKVIISGSVMKLRNTIEVNARIIDVASASIITAENVRSTNVNNLQDLVVEMAGKIIKNFPLEGYVANRDGERVVIDLGTVAGVKPGMKFMAYKEGEVVRHPKTDEILYVTQNQTGMIRVTAVQNKISEGVIIEETSPGSVEYGDFVKSMGNQPASYTEDETLPVAADKGATYQAGPIDEPKKIEPKATKTVKAAPPKSGLSAEVQEYLDKLRQGDSKEARWAAKKLFKTEPYEPEMLEEVNRVLLMRYNSQPNDGHHVDAMAWLCKLLANSKQYKYQPTVQEVAEHAVNAKLKKHAAKAAGEF